MLGDEWPLVERYLKEEKWVLSEVGFRLTSENDMPLFKALVRELSGMAGNTEQGGVYAILSWLRYRLVRFTHFKFDDKLVEMLENTDLDDDVPVSYLLPPYSFIYLELGVGRNLQTFILNEATGEHILEGAYVERGYHRECGDCLYITLTGSPLGKSNATDDATMSVLLPLTDLNAPLSKVLHDAFMNQRDEVRRLGLKQSAEESVAVTLEALKLVTKALLYLGLPEARKVLHAERSELEKAGRLLKSSAKRAKLERKIAKAYDYVLVEAGSSERKPSGTGEAHRSLKTHWRRGHYRMQAHGPQNSLRKMLFIKPMLISGDVVGEPERPSTYRVK